METSGTWETQGGPVTPVRSDVAPPNGEIAGNVYRMSLQTPTGEDLIVRSGKQVVSVLASHLPASGSDAGP